MVGRQGLLGCVWCEGDCESRSEGSVVPARTKDAQRNNQVRKRSCAFCVVFLALLTLCRRSGDTVSIRVNASGETLDIKDNHPIDHEIGASMSDSGSVVGTDEH